MGLGRLLLGRRASAPRSVAEARITSGISRATRPRLSPSETTEAAATAATREATEHADVSDLPAHESAAVIVLAFLIALLVICLLVWISRNDN
jgi:hypothetical protein